VVFEGQNVVDADVWVGCRHTKSGYDGYRVEIGAGPHEFVAGLYWPGKTWWLEGRIFKHVAPGLNDTGFDIKLEPPPDWRLMLRMQIKIDLQHKVLVGKDDWLHVVDCSALARGVFV